MENKIYFRDTLGVGRRGIQWTQGKRDAYYRLCWFGRCTIPARGTATNIGGTTRHGYTGGGGGPAYIQGRFLSYASSIWGHGINNVVGAFAQTINWGPDTVSNVSVLNATTILINWAAGYTAATQYGNVFVWGATTTLY